MEHLRARMIGAITGAAVGDALGGAVEGYSPEQIAERHGGPITGIVGPWHEDWRGARPMSPYHKGDGHITDDTLMTHALIDVYERAGDHLSAFDIVDRLVPLLMREPRWIPELEIETVILNRIFLAEKWMVLQGFYAHADPREAGVGNVVNCGAAMYMAPVGVVNAGDPSAAYAEAIDMAGAHQSSYGREAAGIVAASVAAGLAPGADGAAVIDAALDLAHDGTAAAIEATVAAASAHGHGPGLREVLRQAVRPFDTVGETYREPAMDARRPSRTRSIEELPIALGLLAVLDHDPRALILESVNYGRDCDSIATMAGAIAGAIHGLDAIPPEWVAGVSDGSRLDIVGAGERLADVAATIARLDLERAERRLALARARSEALR